MIIAAVPSFPGRYFSTLSKRYLNASSKSLTFESAIIYLIVLNLGDLPLSSSTIASK